MAGGIHHVLGAGCDVIHLMHLVRKARIEGTATVADRMSVGASLRDLGLAGVCELLVVRKGSAVVL